MSGRYDRPLTPEQIAAVKDEGIDFSDIPELDEGFWERAELVEPDNSKPTLPPKRGDQLRLALGRQPGAQLLPLRVLGVEPLQRLARGLFQGPRRGWFPNVPVYLRFICGLSVVPGLTGWATPVVMPMAKRSFDDFPVARLARTDTLNPAGVPKPVEVMADAVTRDAHLFGKSCMCQRRVVSQQRDNPFRRC